MARIDTSIIPWEAQFYVESLVEYLRLNLGNDFQDFLESNRIRPLLDAIGYEMGLMSYYFNAQLKEMFLPTASTRTAMFLLGKLVNYDLRGSSPSQVLVTFFISTPHAFDIPIPSGTQIQAPGSPPVIFETQEDATITIGNLSVDVLAIQGQTLTEIIGTTSLTNEPNQMFTSSRPPLLSTLSLTIDGTEWTQVDNLFDAEEDERVYTSKPNEQGLAVIEFGNGIFGSIPPSNKAVEVSYRVGGGFETNVVHGTITEILTGILDSSNSPVSVSVINAAAAFGGLAQESVEEARINIPRFVRSMDRFVSREDFQAIPQLFDGPEGSVFKSTATTKYIWASHLITIFILSDPPNDSTIPVEPSLALKNAVRSYIEERTLPTVGISVESARIRTIDLVGTVYYYHNFREETARTNVQDALDRVFNYTVREIGDGLRLSDLYAAIDGAIGVDYVQIDFPETSLSALDDEFFILGNVAFTYVRMPRSRS